MPQSYFTKAQLATRATHVKTVGDEAAFSLSAELQDQGQVVPISFNRSHAMGIVASGYAPLVLARRGALGLTPGQKLPVADSAACMAMGLVGYARGGTVLFRQGLRAVADDIRLAAITQFILIHAGYVMDLPMEGVPAADLFALRDLVHRQLRSRTGDGVSPFAAQFTAMATRMGIEENLLRTFE